MLEHGSITVLQLIIVVVHPRDCTLMIVFALMIAGMADIPANIGQDREWGLLAKLKFMPIHLWKDFLKRFLPLLIFSCASVVIVDDVEYAVGVRVLGYVVDGLLSDGFTGSRYCFSR